MVVGAETMGADSPTRACARWKKFSLLFFGVDIVVACPSVCLSTREGVGGGGRRARLLALFGGPSLGG